MGIMKIGAIIVEILQRTGVESEVDYNPPQSRRC